MVVIVEGGLASVPCNKLDGDRLSGKDSGMRRGVVHGCGMGVGARAAQLSRFFFFFLNPNLYSAARTKEYRGGHVTVRIMLRRVW